ncbi:hypothetical protein LINPERHAP2_LOCUS37206 [Linum perenne]
MIPSANQVSSPASSPHVRPPDPGGQNKTSTTSLGNVHNPVSSTSPDSSSQIPSNVIGSQLSYKGALAGLSPQASPTQKSWICVGENDIIPSLKDGIRSLQISKSLKDKLCKPWTNTAIIRLLGKSIGYNYLCHRLNSMWKPVGSLQIIDLDKDCYLVKFGNEQDYFKALTGGPWLILGHYLLVQQWDPSFRVSDKLPSKMVVWVRLPHLPILFYHPQILNALGNLIGKTVRIDFTTQNAERGKFARLAVEIDLDAPLAPVIKLDGAWQKVEYENIPELCFECGMIGHVLESCQKFSNAPPAGVGDAATPVFQLTGSTSYAAKEAEKIDGYGPWMVVSRKGRRQRNDGETDKESSAVRKETRIKVQKRNVSHNGVKYSGKNLQDPAASDASGLPSHSTPNDSVQMPKKSTAKKNPTKSGKSKIGNTSSSSTPEFSASKIVGPANRSIPSSSENNKLEPNTSKPTSENPKIILSDSSQSRADTVPLPLIDASGTSCPTPLLFEGATPTPTQQLFTIPPLHFRQRKGSKARFTRN